MDLSTDHLLPIEGQELKDQLEEMTDEEAHIKNCEHRDALFFQAFSDVTKPHHVWCASCGSFKPAGADHWLTTSMFTMKIL